MIPVTATNPIIIASTGFHITKPLQLVCHRVNTHYLTVACAIDDNILTAGGVLSGLFYFIGFASNILFFKLLSFIPIFYFLFLYYWKRKDFIQIRRM